MPPKRPRYEYEAMSFDKAIEHFFGRGVPLGSPSRIMTQEQLNEALQGHRSNIATPSREAMWLANDIAAYLMLHGHREHDIKPTRYEESWSRHQQKYGTTSSLLLWRTKASIWIEKRKPRFLSVDDTYGYTQAASAESAKATQERRALIARKAQYALRGSGDYDLRTAADIDSIVRALEVLHGNYSGGLPLSGLPIYLRSGWYLWCLRQK